MKTITNDHNNGATRILNERYRQVFDEGWSSEHDAQHTRGELVKAATCYLKCDSPMSPPPPLWPWENSWWKPGDAVRNLEKAGALIAAEIDRLTDGGASNHEAPAASPGPWTQRPKGGWTAETLPEGDLPMVLFIFDGMVDVGQYGPAGQVFIGEDSFAADEVDAWMYVPEYTALDGAARDGE